MDEIVIHEEISRRIEKACASTDIAGYNYMTARYENDVKTYPNRVIVGSETYPPEIARNWELVESLPQVIGDFTWTGWDYIGEAGVGIPAYKWGEGGLGAAYPAQFAFCGDFDITGFRRSASYYREVVFGLTDKPYIAVQNPRHYGEKLIKTPWVISDASACWNYEEMEGKPVIVEVYSNGDEVELLLNNRIIDRKAAGKKVGFRTLFETIYEEGNLTAISYKEGQEVGRCELVTADKDRKLSIEKESYTGLRNKEQELIYLTIESKDKNGILATDDCSKIILSFDGNVDVLGFGSGNPKPNYNFNEGITELFGGRAQIIVKKPMGRATLTVNTENGISATVEL